MRILDTGELPTPAAEKRMRARLEQAIEKPRRSRRTGIIGLATAAALIFGGGAVAWANGPALTGEPHVAASSEPGSTLTGELETLGVEIPAVPKSIPPEEEVMYSAEERAKRARAGLLWPTLRKLSRLDGFVDGQFVGESLRWNVTWHGALPTKARKIIDAGEETGLQIEVSYADYTTDELEDALERFARAVDKEGEILLVSLSVSADHNAISVGGPKLDDPDVRAKLRRIARKTIGDIPVRMKVKEFTEEINADRVMLGSFNPALHEAE